MAAGNVWEQLIDHAASDMPESRWPDEYKQDVYPVRLLWTILELDRDSH